VRIDLEARGPADLYSLGALTLNVSLLQKLYVYGFFLRDGLLMLLLRVFSLQIALFSIAELIILAHVRRGHNLSYLRQGLTQLILACLRHLPLFVPGRALLAATALALFQVHFGHFHGSSSLSCQIFLI